MKTRATTTRIIVHHSASPRSTTIDQVRGWHVKDRGFEDIGYHFFIDGDGVALKGRDIHKIGAHAAGANEDSIGVCVAGNNTVLEHRWTPIQIEELRELVSILKQVYGPLVVCGHRDAKGGTTATECPGLDIQAVL